MGDYITISEISTGEYSEKHSRFIATLYPCKTEDEAATILKEHKSKYWDARHNVYAYILKDNTTRFSDDGEPHGTAAKPILDVLSFSGITDALLVVTRYFGGILLGTGGLVRAYSTSAKEAVNNAKPVTMMECDSFCIVMPYSEQGKITNLLKEFDALIENTEFSQDVRIEFSLVCDKTQDFHKKLCEISSAKLKAEFVTKKILPIFAKK